MKSNKLILPALLLCFFLGAFGIHRFYIGKWPTGLLYLCTAGLFGIGWFYDLIVLTFGLMNDGDGNTIAEWV